MADIVTRRELEDAKIDAKDLGEAVNEKVIVSPRYGEDFKSIPLLSDELQGAIETAAAAGAGANGWTDLLIQTVDGSTQRAKNSLFQSQINSKAGTAYVDAKDASLQSQIDQKATAAYLDNALTEQTQTVNTALSQLSTAANKFYPTKAEAEADIASIEVNQPVQVGESGANGGLWYKATAEATTLTKSAYDSYALSQNYSDMRERTGLYRNLFNTDEIKGIDLSRITNQAGRTAVSRVAPKSIKITATSSTTLEVRWRFSAAHFKETNVISASARIKSVTASAGAAVQAVRMGVWQTTAAGSSIKTNFTTIAGEEAVSVEQNALIENIPLDASAVYVEVGFSINAVAARDLIFEDFCISAASKAAFIRPQSAPLNLFPDPLFSGQYSSIFSSIVKTENSEQIMTFEETSALRQSLYQIPAIGRFAPGAIVRFGADVMSDAVNATHMTMVFFNAAGVEITRSTQASRVANSYDTLSSEFVVPANCARVDVRFMKDGNATSAKFKNVFLYSTYQNRVTFNPQFPLTLLHVDAVNGLDTNNGTQTAPLKTLSRAMIMAGYNTLIIVAEGDYYEAPQVTSKIGVLTVMAARNSRVRLIGGTKLTGFTKTSGYTKVWQVPLAANPVIASDRSGYWLYQLGAADTNTTITKRWEQHHGRTYRNPDCTQIWLATSIAEIEAATKPMWFWNAGVLYLSCVGFGDPNAVDIRIPETVTSPFYTANTTKNQCVKLVGIESYFWLNGFRVWDFAQVELIGCRGIGNRTNGFETSDNSFVRQVGCEGYGNWVDGNGGHVYRANTTKKSCRYEGLDNYFHDNGDDGFSYHEMWTGTTTGMLCEYNGDRGCADAVGAHFTHHNPIFYKNGQGQGLWIIDDGAGISCVGTAVDGGVSTDTTVFNPYAEGNLVNFNMGGSNENVMNLFNPKSIDPVTAHYSSSAGNLNLYDASYSGSGTIKNQVSTGNINVISTLPVPL